MGQKRFNAPWKQLEPSEQQDRPLWLSNSCPGASVGTSGTGSSCIATRRQVPKRVVRIIEEERWCESCQQCLNNVPRCLMKGIIRGKGEIILQR